MKIIENTRYRSSHTWGLLKVQNQGKSKVRAMACTLDFQRFWMDVKVGKTKVRATLQNQGRGQGNQGKTKVQARLRGGQLTMACTLDFP